MPQALAWRLRGSTASRARWSLSEPLPASWATCGFHSEAHISLPDIPKLLPSISKLLIWGNEKERSLQRCAYMCAADSRDEESGELEKVLIHIPTTCPSLLWTNINYSSSPFSRCWTMFDCLKPGQTGWILSFICLNLLQTTLSDMQKQSWVCWKQWSWHLHICVEITRTPCSHWWLWYKYLSQTGHGSALL